jgi:hypothetical protein
MKMIQENEATEFKSLDKQTIVLSEVYYEKKDLSNDIFLFLFLWMIIFLL